MASDITLNADLETESLTVDSGASFDANGHNVTTGNVTLDAPNTIQLGNGSVWTVSGNWIEQTASASSWGYSGSKLVMTGSGKSITKILTAQYFYHLTIASGASITATTSCISAYGDVKIYGEYTVGATMGIYFGAKLYLYSTATLSATSSISIYDYFGGGGVAYFHPDASLTTPSCVFSYPKKATSVLAPGDYSGCSSFAINGGSYEGTIALQSGNYTFNALVLQSGGTADAVGLDCSGLSGTTVTVKSYLRFQGSGVPTSAYIDNSSSDTDWNIYDEVDLSHATAGDLTWTAGTGLITLIGGTNYTLDFAGSTTEDVYCNKTAGTVEFIDGIHTVFGDFPDALTISGADITGYAGETIWVRGDFTISSGDWTLGNNTNWRFYADVDWSGVVSMSYSTDSTMSCMEDGDWTWKDNSSTECPYNLYVRLNRTLTAYNSSGTYTYVRGQIDVHGTIDSQVTYLTFGYSTADVRVHPYGAITMYNSIFFNTPSVGITKMDGTISGGNRRILWYKAVSSSYITAGDYDVEFYIYGTGSSILNMTDGDTYTVNGIRLVPSSSAYAKIKLPHTLYCDYITFSSGTLGEYIVDAENAFRWYVGGNVAAEADPTTANYHTVTWQNYNVDKFAIEMTPTSSANLNLPLKTSSVVAPPIVINAASGVAIRMLYHALECYSLNVIGGEFDPGDLDINTTKDLIIGEDATVDNTGLGGGCTWTVGGKCSFHGDITTEQDLTGTADWYVDATESLAAYNTDLAYCNATGVAGFAYDSTDSGNNVNWTFGTGVNTLYFPQNGINFIMRTLQDVAIDPSNYALGFYGAGENEHVEIGEYQTKTFLVDKGGTVGEVQCRNVTYASDTTGYVDHVQTPVNLRNIPNYQATLNIRLLQPEDVFVALAEAKFYNGYDENIPPDGLNIKVAELRHTNTRLNVVAGGSDSEWFDAENGEWFRLTQSPGERGVKSNSFGLWVGDQHDWYLAISVSPEEIGSRVFGLQVRLEYI